MVFFGITHALNLYLSVGMVMATLQFICYLWSEYVSLAVRSFVSRLIIALELDIQSIEVSIFFLPRLDCSLAD